MAIRHATSLKLLVAAALLVGAVGVLALRSPDFATSKKSISDAMNRGEYASAAKQARSFVDSNPKEVEAWGAWIFALAMDNRVAEARDTLETAKKAFPELVDKYAKPVSETIDKIELGHQATFDAESAMGRGLPSLAARKYAEAYEILKEDDRLGLKAAHALAAVHEPVKAALILRKIADKGDPAVVKEAQTFFEANKAVLTAAAVTETDLGWKTLETLGSADDAATKAKEAFERAVALRPDHAGLAAAGVETMRSPYFGLAAAAAASSSEWEVQGALKKAAGNGVPPPSGPLSGRAGTALGEAFCEDGTLEVLDGAFGDSAKAWGTAACEQTKGSKDWQQAVDVFDKANRAGIAPAEALAGFEEAKGLFAREWPARFPSASYAGRTTCNIAFLEAWIATLETPVDQAALDRKVAASTACPTNDFSRKRLDEKVASIRGTAAKRDAFTFKVCNRSSEGKVRIAYMRGKPDEQGELALKGWWDVDKGKCVDLPATYAGEDQADVYVTAYSTSVTWWPWEKAEISACLPSEKFERRSALGEVACTHGEEPRGFLKLTARKAGGKNGITYNIKDPA